MSKQYKDKVIFEKSLFDGTPQWKHIKHIDFQDEDEIICNYEEAFYSENNSWDAHYRILVQRSVLETDEEYEIRVKMNKEDQDRYKKQRYENYLKLKKEFEGE